MIFIDVSNYFQQLEQTSSRLEMTEILSDLFKATSVDEISPVVHISLGQLRPKFDKLEFNMAEKMVIRAMALAYGVDEKEVKATYKKVGDIGDTSLQLQETRSKKHKNRLSVTDVFEKLNTIAEYLGSGSQDEKVQGVAELLKGVDPLSAKYLVRMIVGKLRLGFSDMTILDALSWMEHGDKSARKQLEEAYQLSPDIGKIARLTKQYSSKQVTQKTSIQVGVPIIPALAQRLKTADEMVEKMGLVGVDPKYDGTRVQIHYKRNESRDEKKDTIKTFTRNLDESSYMFPELDAIGEYIKADEVILDTEAIGYDPETDALLPFQMTIQRKRKHGIADSAREIPLRFFIFDILYKDGRSLINEKLETRNEILEQTIIDSSLTKKTKYIITKDPEEIRKYHADLLAQGLEGAMVKRWDAPYYPGRRGWAWVKFKEAEGSKAKLSDTIDAVVMGLYPGKGKRTKFGVGAFLIGIGVSVDQGAKNQEQVFVENNFFTISKVGTGLTDDQWFELKERAQPYKTDKQNKRYHVHKDLLPDIWLDPGIIVEVAADEVTQSPNHTAGYALRFPRLIKFRDDKDAQQVTTLSELRALM